MRILVSLDPTLVDSCYSRLLEAIRNGISNSADERALKPLVKRALEAVFASSLDNHRMSDEEKGAALADKLHEITEALSFYNHVNKFILEKTLGRIRIGEL